MVHNKKPAEEREKIPFHDGTTIKQFNLNNKAGVIKSSVGFWLESLNNFVFQWSASTGVFALDYRIISSQDPNNGKISCRFRSQMNAKPYDNVNLT